MVDGPARRAVSCPMCNEKFFPASLPFHTKQCAKRRGERWVPCPYCKKEVIQLDLPAHVKVCPKGAGRGKSPANRSSQSQPASQATLRPEETEGYEPQVLDDGRMGCMHCGRFFTPDRIDHHQGICGALKNARPKGRDGKATQTASKVFNAAAVRTGSGPAFVNAEALKRKQDAEAAKKKKSTSSKEASWRRASEDFQNVCKAARGEQVAAPTSHGPRSGAVTCPYCSRHFDRAAADRHISICANVVNRPKPPSNASPSRSTRAPDSPTSTSRTNTPLRRRPNTSASPGPNQRTLRPTECDSPPSPTPRSSPSRQRHEAISDASGAPPRAPDGRSASCSRLPTVASPGSAGGALRAARDIRRNNSSDKLPQLPNSPGEPGTMSASSSGSGWNKKPPTVPRQRMDGTTLPGDRIDDSACDQSHERTQGTTLKRVGLRKCAMMYRLLNHVPQDALARELADSGVETEEMDKEGLIEALIHQLA